MLALCGGVTLSHLMGLPNTMKLYIVFQFCFLLICLVCLPVVIAFLPPTHFGSVGCGFGGSHGGNRNGAFAMRGGDLWENTTLAASSVPTRRKRNKVYELSGNLSPQSRILSLASAPFRFVKNHFLRFVEKQETKAILKRLQKISVQHVSVPNSTILPQSVINEAVVQSNMLGQPLDHSRLENFSVHLMQWYRSNGYNLHEISGAILDPATATAQVSVVEPKVADVPVDIVFVKELVHDTDSDALLSVKDYQNPVKSDRPMRTSMNISLAPTKAGRINPRSIAAAIGLKPLEHFRWDPTRWKQIAGSPIFSSIFGASAVKLPNERVQLRMIVKERPLRNMEYGVSRSTYTGKWEGELKFDHINLFGGGERLGIAARTGLHGNGGRLVFTDDMFGIGQGYQIEVLRDNLENGATSSTKNNNSTYDAAEASLNLQPDGLHNRHSIALHVFNPFGQKLIPNSLGTISMEKVKARSGSYDSVGSVSLGVGPLARDLPFCGRADLNLRAQVGAHKLERMSTDGLAVAEKVEPIPFTAFAATARQTFPFLSKLNTDGRPIVLALKHCFFTSSRGLPRHEAQAQGASCQIRDGTCRLEAVSSAVIGTTELRIPLSLPIVKQRDTCVVLFGDWVTGAGLEIATTSDLRRETIKHACVGLGIRKSFRGVPLQCNFIFSKVNEGKDFKIRLGVGEDFDI